MRRLWLLLWLFGVQAAQAVSGSWAADGLGATLSHGGISTQSSALRPPNVLPSDEARIVSVSWRYLLTSPPPAGLQVQLCMPGRCVPLAGASGTTLALQDAPAASELRFSYVVQTRGALFPPLRVLSNQVIVNYQ
ncbi:flagellar protein FlhE [Serratia rhizosphaerae]